MIDHLLSGLVMTTQRDVNVKMTSCSGSWEFSRFQITDKKVINASVARPAACDRAS
jgi:hypothetical protein